MPDWDKDSPHLRKNLARVLQEIVQSSERRETPTVEVARRWQTILMEGLAVPDPRLVGAFRGESFLEKIQVKVGSHYGVDAADVRDELIRFEGKLQQIVAELDAMLRPSDEPDSDQLAAIIDLCAWVHAEWVRIHPFANGNGRTARLWANSIAMRYGVPPFIRLRPRPNSGYREAGVARRLETNRGCLSPIARRVSKRSVAPARPDISDACEPNLPRKSGSQMTSGRVLRSQSLIYCRRYTAKKTPFH